MLTVSNLQVRYGTSPRCAAFRSRWREGEIVAVIGPNGAGKSTLAAGHRRRGTGASAATFGLAGASDSGLCAGNTGGDAAWRWCPKGGAYSDRSPWRRTSRSAPPRARTATEIVADTDACSQMFPILQRALPSASGKALRRRAADAGDRSGADVAAKASASRRALAGPCAAHRRAGL